jgi:16S rRNA (guanine527-N7)-methyltransferase
VLARYTVPADRAESVLQLLAALAAEPDPHTTVADPPEALDRHVADSLSGLAVDALRDAADIADLGSGAGFPGLPLAIALPSTRLDLIEAASRKTSVIGRLIAAARLVNARPVTARAEEWAAGGGRDAYDVVTARAVAALPVLVEYAAPLLRPGGSFVAWKGARDPAEESAADRAAGAVGLALVDQIEVEPFEGARDRRLYVFEKVSPTPDRYPRRPGMAAKRPLG